MDLTGKRFNWLVVLKKSEQKRDNKNTYWDCQCDCGNITSIQEGHLLHDNQHNCGCVIYRDIQPGTLYGGMEVLEIDIPESIKHKEAWWKCKCTICGELKSIRRKNLKKKPKSCGCLKGANFREQGADLTGKKMGKLTIIELAYYDKGASYWNCECECGNKPCYSRKYLTSDIAPKSCGCDTYKYNNLKGKKIDYLTILDKLEENDPNKVEKISYWNCQCDCGNIIIRPSHYFSSPSSPKIKSCGCQNSKASKGEEKIQSLLDQNNITYQSEKTFEDCRFPDTNRLAKFDFYVDNKYLIEFDGEQHFNARNSWGTRDSFKKIQTRDTFKNKWCKEHNIPLIRIPYTYYDGLKIEDLLLNTSSFLI